MDDETRERVWREMDALPTDAATLHSLCCHLIIETAVQQDHIEHLRRKVQHIIICWGATVGGFVTGSVLGWF